MIKEETTRFIGGMCERCGSSVYYQAENGASCDQCGRRVEWPATTIAATCCTDGAQIWHDGTRTTIQSIGGCRHA